MLLGSEVRVLSWMRRTMGGSQPGSSSALTALEEVFAPAAAKARLDLESRNERSIPIPSPGDRLLSDRVLVVRVASPPADDEPTSAPSPESGQQ